MSAPALGLRLLPPSPPRRLLWQASSAVLREQGISGEQLMLLGAAALGLALGFPLQGVDLLGFGRQVLEAIGERVDPAELVQATAEATRLCAEGLPAESAPVNPQPQAGRRLPVKVPAPPSDASAEDIELFHRAAAGDPEALAEAHRRWGG